MVLSSNRKTRTKKQWSYYFRENFFWKNPTSFLINKGKKWRFLNQRFLKNFWRKKKLGRKRPYLRRLKTYFKQSLKNKHKFKLYFAIKNEKKLKFFLRQSIKLKRPEIGFYALLQRRLDYILVRSNMVPHLKIARAFIKNGFIFVNDKVILKPEYVVKNIDAVRVDFYFKNYVYNNLLKKCKKQRKNIEINLFTLEFMPYGFLKKRPLVIRSNIALELVRRAYLR